MSAFAPFQLDPKDKLDALRYLDKFHFWHSLDDERRCDRCGRSLTGRQIIVIELPGTRGKLALKCPTPGCQSMPKNWSSLAPSIGKTTERAVVQPRMQHRDGHACTSGE
jgi:hypothetical protein